MLCAAFIVLFASEASAQCTARDVLRNHLTFKKTAAAEVAPQLRLQYFDQPIGEFLVGMEPIRTWKGVPVILTVANGGAGLVLIGQDGRADAEIPVASRFLFVRSNEAALAKAVHGL